MVNAASERSMSCGYGAYEGELKPTKLFPYEVFSSRCDENMHGQ